MSVSYMRRCSGKDRHEDKAAANQRRASLRASPDRRTPALTVYSCDQCLGWHVGGAGQFYKSRQRRTGKRPNKRLRGRV